MRYFAHDAGGNMIARDGLTDDALSRQTAGLLAAGYHVTAGRIAGCDCGFEALPDPAAVLNDASARAAVIRIADLLGPGCHLDTSGDDYVSGDGTPLFTAAEAERYDAAINAIFRRSADKTDPFAVAYAVIER